MRLTLIAVLALSVAACSPAEETASETAAPAVAEAPTIAAEGPSGEELVQALYDRESVPTAPADTARFFSPELATKLVPPSGEVGMIDWDYRVGAQDYAPKNLKLEEYAGGPTGSVIRAAFSNYDEQRTVEYTLCRDAAGALRITNIKTLDEGAFDMRKTLELPESAC